MCNLMAAAEFEFVRVNLIFLLATHHRVQNIIFSSCCFLTQLIFPGFLHMKRDACFLTIPHNGGFKVLRYSIPVTPIGYWTN